MVMTNRNDFETYDVLYGILNLLEYLERAKGRDGNGYALIRNNRVTEVVKGGLLTNRQIYDMVKPPKEWDYFVWHTRKASMSLLADEHFQPYVLGNNCLAMNGLEEVLRPISRAFRRTGSDILFRITVGMDMELVVRALLKFEKSTFVGCLEGRPYVIVGGGDMYRWNMGDITFHSSEFPDYVSEREQVDSGYVWTN